MRVLGVAIIAIAALNFVRPASGQYAEQTYGEHSRWHSDDSRMYFDYGDPLMASVIQSPDGRTEDVRLTTANALFSFLHSANGYFAVRDVTIEIDEAGSPEPVVTKNFIDTLHAQSFEESTSKTTWHAMSEPITVTSLDSSKHYTLHVTVRDDIDGMVLRPQPIALRVPIFSDAATNSGIEIGDIQLSDSANGATYYTSALGNTYMFSHDVTGIVSFRIASALGAEPTVEVSVRQHSNSIYPSDTGARYNGTLDLSDLHRGSTMILASADSLLQYKLVPTGDSGMWTAVFHVAGKEFEQGNYEFSVTVRAGGKQTERAQKNDFNFVWQNMPLSLEDPTDAIEPLALLTTPDQIQALSSGSKQEMRQKLYAFWKKQDPTPGTAFNERMATFYQRVDYADFNYAIGPMLNGAMTDRGRVYLLYGPPTNVERTFIPGDAPTETWNYSNNVNRIFHFAERNGQGNYQLTDMRDLSVAEKN